MICFTPYLSKYVILHIFASSYKIAIIMKIPLDSQAIAQTVERLEAILDSHASYITEQLGARHIRCDEVVSVRRHIFAIEWKRSGTLGQVALAANTLKQEVQHTKRRLIPLVSVPYMGVRGRKYCDDVGVSWLDLSGNSSITARNLYVRERGNRNLFRNRGPLNSAFGPKGSRIARWMLTHPGEAFRQRDLAKAVGLNEGYTSRVIRKLLDSHLVTRGRAGIQVEDPDLLLGAWNEVYRFRKHALIPGHITARSGLALAWEVADTLDDHGIRYALTGLPAAWFYTQYAAFRLVSVYIDEVPSTELKRQLSFREDRRGANIWFVVPNDEGVFQNVNALDGVRCVHPVQAYLDLHEHPERSAEASDELKYRCLNWKGTNE